MNITLAKYYSSKKDIIEAVIDGVSLDIPTSDLANRHYAEILRQVAAGELTIADAD
jgi:hypothetical protein